MKQVSNAYKLSMKSPMRNPSYVQIYFENIDTEAARDGVWESVPQTDYSEVNTLNYPYRYSETVATLELNRWVLDKGSIVNPGRGYKDGFVSNVISNAEGVLDQPVVLTRRFSSSHGLAGLTLTYDTRSKEWPSEINTKAYSGTNLVGDHTLTPATTESILSVPIAQVDKLILTITGTRLPYRRPRLEAVAFGVGRIFTNKDILRTSQKHDVDPLSRRLPHENFSFTILDFENQYDPDNPAGVYQYVDERSPIFIQFGYELPDGIIEWIKPDKYLLNAKPVVRNNQATFQATGLIGSLSGLYYKSKVGRKSMYDMARDILSDAQLIPSMEGTEPWDIDESLRNMYTDAVLPIATHANCLQMIAHACRCRLYTDDDNIIHIRPFGVTVKGIYSGVWTDNGHEWYSDWSSVDAGNVHVTDVTLELNRWVLDDSNQTIVSDNTRDRGYVGNIMSDNTGSYLDPVPVATKVFDVPHDLPVIAIRFDEILQEYATKIQIKYYAGNTLLDVKTVPVTETEVRVTTPLAVDCTKIELYLLSSLPYRRPRINKIYFRETDFVLDYSTIKEGSQNLSKIDKLRSVNVSRYAYAVSDAETVLYEGVTTETNLHVEFTGLAQNVRVSVSGGSLITSQIYGRAADLSLKPGTKTVKVYGKTLSESSVIKSYSVSENGSIDQEKNPLITNEEMSDALADHVIKYLTMRNTYDIVYRGNPEMEVGDVVGLQTRYTPDMDALMLTDEISFNGALSGKMKLKGLI